MPGDRGQRYEARDTCGIVGWTNYMDVAIRLASPKGRILDRQTGECTYVGSTPSSS